MHFDEFSFDAEKTAGLLGHELVRGSLMLLLGTGASRGMGLPNWHQLVRQCLREVGLASTADTVDESTSNEALRQHTDRITGAAKKARRAFPEVVQKALYHSVSYTADTLGQKLLVALGALMAGSNRGKVDKVVSFNFDDVLEWHLSCFGLTSSVVTGFPYMSTKDDVTVYHPHGFLPLDSTYADKQTTEIVFSDLAYDERMGALDNPWNRLLRYEMSMHCFLAVGLSGDDPSFGLTFANVKDSIAPARRPTGVWLFYDPLSYCKKRTWMIDRNIIPLYVEDIPAFILNICRKAMAEMRR